MNSTNIPKYFCSYLLRSRPTTFINKRLESTTCQASEEAVRQSNLFKDEVKRQKAGVGRIEKIEVVCEGPKGPSNLVMNKNISTPYDCAKHIGDIAMNRTAVALVNGDTLWHMHKPLTESCNVQLLHYNVAQPAMVNKAFWRTCSFLLGAVISKAFKDTVSVQLHSFPIPNVKSGSFVYDAQLGLEDWTPTTNELRVLSAEMVKFCQEKHPIHSLDISVDLALEMFKNNPHKTKQIPDIAASNNGVVTVFKAGLHVDISKGPMVTNTSHVGKTTIANAIKLQTDIPGGPIYRFQGVALPMTIILNHVAFDLLEQRAKKMNSARIPSSQPLHDDHSFVKQVVV